MPYGTIVASAALWTPGNSRARCTAANMSRRASGCSFLTSEKSSSVTRPPAATKPGLSALALSAPRKKNPALKRSMSESAICAMTEICRGAKNRLKRPTPAGSPGCCFRSLTRSVFVAVSAGPRLKRTVAMRQNKKVMHRTNAFGCKFTMSEKLTEPEASKRPSEWSRRSLHQRLMMRPSAPPRIARSNPSKSNWRTIRQRDAPSARRNAISFARVVPRASSMFARFRLATNKTTAAMPISRVATSVIGPSS